MPRAQYPWDSGGPTKIDLVIDDHIRVGLACFASLRGLRSGGGITLLPKLCACGGGEFSPSKRRRKKNLWNEMYLHSRRYLPYATLCMSTA